MSKATRLAALAAALLVVVVLGAAGAVRGGDQFNVARSSLGAARAPMKPNVIVFLADDLDFKLMRYLPHVRELIGARGATFSNFYVEQSTCCTSRATFFSGQYTHNHGVRGNHYPEGGFFAWRGRGEDQALPLWLQAAGYRNAFLGKYLNEYPYPATYPASAAQKARLRHYVPPGWDEWQSPVLGNPYQQFDYGLNTDGVVDKTRRAQYLDAELAHRLLALIEGGLGAGMDFRDGGKLAYFSSYSPHKPFGHPKSLDEKFKGVTYPHTPSFNEADVSDKLGISSLRRRLTPAMVAHINSSFRNRIRSVQTLDATVAHTVAALRDQGTLDNTYLIFSSDNGYNMGEHRLDVAKYNQFEETVNVPLLISGPGIRPGTRVDELTGNIDIAPSIAAMTGTPVPDRVDGLSLLPLLTGARTSLDRDHLLISRGLIPLEKRAAAATEEFPESDVESPRHARISDFNGIVSTRYKLVDYLNNDHDEFYDELKDPYELDNLLARGVRSFRQLPLPQRRTIQTMREDLARLLVCAGPSCRL